MKKERQKAILDIIRGQEIETQEQLLEQLRRRGIETTQTTVSRDIRKLGIVKVQTEQGISKYVAAQPEREKDVLGKLERIFQQGVLSVDAAQNIVILKTMPGLAPAAGAAIDSMELADLAGCLAGNDTVLLVMRGGEQAERFREKVRKMIQG